HAQIQIEGWACSFVSRILSTIYFFNSMPSMHTQGVTNRQSRARVGACALRVGMEPIVRHVVWALNVPFSTDLRSCMPKRSGDIGHAIRCHPVRNLLFFRAKLSSACVPGRFFEHQSRSFSVTLTLADLQVYLAGEIAKALF